MRLPPLLLAGLVACLMAAPAAARPEASPRSPAPRDMSRQAQPPASRETVARAARRRAAPPPAALEPGAQCRVAITAAEQQHGIAPGLLGAIGRVESGRADLRGGGVTPWPWTINAEGQGRYFDNKIEAIAAVQALQARGITVIDVGCMQVNLHHHPAAFASLDEAFDPVANARYAALFLKRLYGVAGADWERAAGHYHSVTPERAEGYRAKVIAAWTGAPMPPAGPAGGSADPALAQRVFKVNGTTVRALALNGRPDLTGQRAADLAGLAPLRMTGQQVRGRPVFMVEVAQATESRRR